MTVTDFGLQRTIRNARVARDSYLTTLQFQISPNLKVNSILKRYL